MFLAQPYLILLYILIYQEYYSVSTEVGIRSSAPAKHAKTPSGGCRTFGANLRTEDQNSKKELNSG